MSTIIQGATSPPYTSSQTPKHANVISMDEMDAAEALMLLRYGPECDPWFIGPCSESSRQDLEAAGILMNMSQWIQNAVENPGNSDDATTSQRSRSGSDADADAGEGGSVGTLPESQGSSSPSSSPSSSGTRTGKVRKANGRKKSSPSSTSPKPGRAKVAKVTTTRSGRTTRESVRAREGREAS